MYRLVLISTDPVLQVNTQQWLQDLPFTLLVVSSAAEARAALSLHACDALLIDEVLVDESGLHLAEQLGNKSEYFIVLLCEAVRAAALQAETLERGVLVLGKPLHESSFKQGLILVLAALNRLKILRKQKDQLAQKLEDMKILSRAKLILMEVLKLSEGQAHKFVERQAMERRLSKRQICESIIQTYR